LQCVFSRIDGSLEMPKQGTESESKDMMFDAINATWNPVVGCYHNCCYCWAKRLAETRLKHMEKYEKGFTPRLALYELKKRFTGKFVFVSDMGDLFGEWVPKEWIIKVIEAMKNSPNGIFLFLTKNPKRYSEFLELYPSNLVLGATIETNRKYPVTDAPSPIERYKAMAKLPWKNKLISIEPIMDFDLEIFVQWMKEIKPIVVYVGYDNYGNGLPEPSLVKTEELITQLQVFTKVRRKTIGKAWWEV
jgi:DNA repair photolyase